MSDFRGRGRGGFGPPGGRGGGGRGGRGGYGGGGGSFQDVPMPQMAQHPTLVPQKLGHGTVGRPVNLVANFYKLNISDVEIFHYDVEITKFQVNPQPEKPAFVKSVPPPSPDNSDSTGSSEKTPTAEKFIRLFSPLILKKVLDEKKDMFKDVAFVFDGYKSLYTTRQLVLDAVLSGKPGYKVTITIDGRPKDFSFRLRLVERVAVREVLDYYAGKGNTVGERTLSAYEVALNYIFGLNYENFRRSHYDIDTAEKSPKTRDVEYVFGFNSGVAMTEVGLALNMHLKTSCIVNRQYTRLLDLVQVVSNIRPTVRPHPGQLLDANTMLKHLRFFTNHSRREITYTIERLIPKYPKEFEFNQGDKKTTIHEYFLRLYGIELLDLPLVKTTGKHARLLPLELCMFKPDWFQFLPMSKINSAIQRELLMKSTNAPNVYFNKLDTSIKKVASSHLDLQRQFGISLETKPVTFQGRMIPAPQQVCGNPRDRFYSVKNVPKKWAVFCFDATIPLEILTAFVDQMVERARLFGLNLDAPHPVSLVKIDKVRTIQNAFFNLQKRTQAEFVFVGIPNLRINFSGTKEMPPLKSSEIYNQVKHFCDQKFGLMSQCFDVEKMVQIPGGYFDNFLLKVNGKLGGLNSVIDESELYKLPFNISKTMFVGLDVNHPVEAEKFACSIAVAVGSLDRLFSRYTSSIRVQKREGTEIIEHAGQLIAELLEQFYEENKTHPENLIVFRDGVSEGQFEKIKNKEVALIEAGINKSGKPAKLTVIVTMKHHNTRFALTQVNTGARRPTWNVPSGTVVDNTIVNPQYKMFYLNSHFSPLGTSKPTKYVVLRDDLNMSADTVQQMTFIACYNSIRTRSVLAIPTPIRYAHLCAYRAKLHVQAQIFQFEQEKEGAPPGTEGEIIARFNQLIQVDHQFRKRLYYC